MKNNYLRIFGFPVILPAILIFCLHSCEPLATSFPEVSE